MTMHAASVTDVSTILGEIERSNTAAMEENQTGPCVVTLNLVVYVDDPGYSDWVLERAGRVADKHPSRLIVLDATRSDGGADVATGVHRGSGCTVLTQRVDLAIAGVEPRVVASLVDDLAIAGTHTVLWWSSAKITGAPLLEALLPLVGTLVVDSSGAARGEEAVGAIAAFLEQHPSVAVYDFAYMRLAPWREMIAQFFDDPSLFDDLFSLRKLEIAAGSEAEIVYLAGWLGSRLSWQVRDSGTFVARDGHEVPFKRTLVGDRRRVSSVTLRSTDSTYTAALSEDASVVRLSVEGSNAKPAWYTPLQRVDNTSLLESSTISEGPDQIFEVTIETVRALLG